MKRMTTISPNDLQAYEFGSKGTITVNLLVDEIQNEHKVFGRRFWVQWHNLEMRYFRLSPSQADNFLTELRAVLNKYPPERESRPA